MDGRLANPLNVTKQELETFGTYIGFNSGIICISNLNYEGFASYQNFSANDY